MAVLTQVSKQGINIPFNIFNCTANDDAELQYLIYDIAWFEVTPICFKHKGRPQSKVCNLN